MNSVINLDIRSEVGELEAVLIHTPGQEVENMTPRNAERALYSDILNLNIVQREYAQFKSILEKFTRTLEMKDLLREILQNKTARERLIDHICRNEQAECLAQELLDYSARELATLLIEGVPLKKDTLTRFMSGERYALQPLHNFFYMRDSAITVFDNVLIARMASQVREREAIIMEAIFDFHPLFRTTTFNPVNFPDYHPKITIEGGDILIAREDILLIGLGARTTTYGVDFILERLKEHGLNTHVLVQELPHQPESFIHLDMVFTFLDTHTCLIYEPLILDPNRYRTIHISVANGEVEQIEEEKNLLEALDKLNMPVDYIPCGGKHDEWIQEREQWHSGANFFALAPGKVMGYGRNVHTMEALNQHGFEILSAQAILDGRVNPQDYHRFAIAIDGSELARGGGGCRCMTMPLRRKLPPQ